MDAEGWMLVRLNIVPKVWIMNRWKFSWWALGLTLAKRLL